MSRPFSLAWVLAMPILVSDASTPVTVAPIRQRWFTQQTATTANIENMQAFQRALCFRVASEMCDQLVANKFDAGWVEFMQGAEFSGRTPPFRSHGRKARDFGLINGAAR